MKLSIFIAGLVLTATLLPATELAAGWSALGRTKPEAALRVFDPLQNAADPAVAREARFGRALALLIRQPANQTQVDEARTALAALADGHDDDPALGARYYLGRIAQYHLAAPDPAEAARQWRLLLAAKPDSLWAQTALSRLALLELYEFPSGNTTPEKCLAAAETLLPLATLPAAKSELHLALADAVLHYRLQPARALPHLLAANQLALLDPPTAADVIVQIAEISALAGADAQAAVFYQKLLDSFPRDQRCFTVREKLKVLATSRQGQLQAERISPR